ncbi:hypothetical protein CFP56_022748 [Quercus suber]|uniref:RNase H type-1 domain-containing protein n=1 Tax=Quercus suber TaxID=58331 RepID=A0AAW0KCE7_QUESU
MEVKIWLMIETGEQVKHMAQGAAVAVKNTLGLNTDSPNSTNNRSNTNNPSNPNTASNINNPSYPNTTSNPRWDLKKKELMHSMYAVCAYGFDFGMGIDCEGGTAAQSITEKTISGEIGHIVQGILCYLDCFGSWKVQHVKREFNRVAHELAHHARCKEVNQVWEGCSPPIVIHLILQDRY